MRILIDTDVVLDVALARQPHLAASADVLRWAETHGTAAVSWHTLPNCAYLLKNSGRSFLEHLLALVHVAQVGTAEARRALHLPFGDLEDAFQAASALAWQADFIVSRNLRHFAKSPVPALSPAAFLRKVETEDFGQ
jgi:predicted nucleic acid-binding protein